MIAARRMAGNKPTAVVDAVSSGESSDEEQELNERRRAVAAAEALAQARAHEQRIELRGTEAYGAASNSEAQRKPKKPIKSYFSEGIDKARMKFTDGGSSPSALGALSAAAMDLGGVAAPEGTSLRPDYERKGYYLNRWSVDNSRRPSSLIQHVAKCS